MNPNSDRDTPTNPALLASVLEAPADDAPRLVYADWLDEHGQPERAEFIRDCIQVMGRHTDCPTRLADLKAGRPVPLRCGACDYCKARRRAEQYYSRHPWLADRPYAVAFEPTPLDGEIPTGPGITLIVRRGFVAEVRCTAAAWCGGVCGRCGRESPETRAAEDAWRGKCPACSGTGRTPGVAGAVCRAQPVERVEFSDKRPYWNGGGYAWFRSDRARQSPAVPAAANVTPELFGHLTGQRVGEFRYKAYSTDHAALDALSAAALAFGRDEARRLAVAR